MQMKNNKIIENTIIKTIVFFDIFNYPLTLFEIWKFCNIKCKLLDIKKCLKDNTLKNIEENIGFYHLAGKKELIQKKNTRYNSTSKKIKKAIWIAKLFKFIPWIKMIAIAGFKGPHNLEYNGDIDFFVITKRKKIWTTRFFCVGFIKMLNLRPKINNKKNKICLSFYVAENNLNLEKLMLKKKNSDKTYDIDFVYWLSGFVPIYNIGQTYEKFSKKNNWIKKYLPNFFWTSPNERRSAGKSFGFFYYFLINLIFGNFELILKKIQLKILPEELKNLMNIDTRVIINDKMLKLHSKDRREEYRKKFEKKYEQLK